MKYWSPGAGLGAGWLVEVGATADSAGGVMGSWALATLGSAAASPSGKAKRFIRGWTIARSVLRPGAPAART